MEDIRFRMKKERIREAEKYVIMLLVGIFSGFVFYYVYPKGSDIKAHAEMAEKIFESSSGGLISWCSEHYAYPLWHLLYLFIKKCMIPLEGLLLNRGVDFSALCATFACTIGIVGTYLAGCNVYTKMLPEKYKRYGFLLAALLIFTGPYYVESVNDSYYLGQGIVMPWHNPTTIMVYPFAIVCFGIYYSLANNKTDGKPWKQWIIFSSVLLVSGLAKPSFYQMFIPGMALFCLIELILSKGKKFLFCMYSLVSTLPTCILMLVQHGMTIKEPTQVVEETSGIVIAGIGIEWLKVQKLYSEYHPFQSLMLLWIFPLFVLVLYLLNRERSGKMTLAISCFASGMLQYTFFYLHMRPQTGDFAWGYYISVAILFISCSAYFIQLCENKKWQLIKYIGILLYLGHVVFGIIYCIKLMNPEFLYADPLF